LRALVVALALLTGCAGPSEVSDWEREHGEKVAPVEATPVPPPYPQAAKLLEFPVDGVGGFRFFVDGGSLSVDRGGVVRYVLVAQSPAGGQSLTYEALRCPSAEHRLYATGRGDGTWLPSRGAWQPVRNARAWQRSLYIEYFCPQKIPIRDAAEGVRALQAGGHPFARGLNSPNLGF